MKETWLRLAVKTVEWRITGVLLSGALGWILTGDFVTGAVFGGIYNLVRLVAMPIRDAIWNKVRWQTDADAPPAVHSDCRCGRHAKPSLYHRIPADQAAVTSSGATCHHCGQAIPA